MFDCIRNCQTLECSFYTPTVMYTAWKIPWTEEPGGLQSMGSLRVGHDWATSLSLFTFMHWRRKWQPTPVFLPGESQGRGSLVGCRLWGCMESHRVGHNRSDLAAAAAAVMYARSSRSTWPLHSALLLHWPPFHFLPNNRSGSSNLGIWVAQP